MNVLSPFVAVAWIAASIVNVDGRGEDRGRAPAMSSSATESRFDASVLRERLARGEDLSASEWRHALNAHGVVRMRERYAAEEPVAVSIVMPEWLGLAELQLVPRSRALAPARAGTLVAFPCGNSWHARRQRDLYQPLGTLPLGRHALDFDVVIHRRPPGTESESPCVRSMGPDLLSRTSLRSDVEVVAHLDDVVPPVEGVEYERAIRDALSVKFSRLRREDGAVCTPVLWLRPDLARHPNLRGTVLSLRVELLHRGEPASSLRITATGSDVALPFIAQSDDRFRQRASHVLDMPLELEGNSSAREDWSLRVTGVRAAAGTSWCGERRYAGSLVVGLAELVR